MGRGVATLTPPSSLLSILMFPSLLSWGLHSSQTHSQKQKRNCRPASLQLLARADLVFIFRVGEGLSKVFLLE